MKSAYFGIEVEFYFQITSVFQITHLGIIFGVLWHKNFFARTELDNLWEGFTSARIDMKIYFLCRGMRNILRHTKE